MSDQGNHNGQDKGERRAHTPGGHGTPNRQDHHGAVNKEHRYSKTDAPAGEKRYGKPATAPNGERRYGKPASAPSGERRFGKPATAADGERRYGKPASAPSGDRRFGKPASATDGERRYGKPASAPSGERRFSKPASATDGERRFSKPASAPSGERRFGKPASATDGERRYGKPASAPSGERRFGKPATATDGDRRYGKPASASSGERHYGKPATAPSGERRFGKPATATDGEHRYGKPASAPSGERRFSKPATATDGERRYGKPASAPSGDRRFGKPATATDGERRYGKPASAPSGEHRYGRPAGAPIRDQASSNPENFQGTLPSVRRPADRQHGERTFSRSGFTKRPAAPHAPARRFRDAQPFSDDASVERTGLTPGARRVALDVLRDVHEHGAYASLSLQEHLMRAGLSPVDRRLTTSIVYATLEQQIQIDFALDRLMEHPTSEPIQRDILRLSACQILFHDRVPDSAAVNEGVNLARALGMEGAAGFLNAVLRNLVRAKAEIPWPKREDGLREYLNIMGSVPMWLVDKLIATYGEAFAEQIIMHRTQSHEMVLRPNFMKLTDEAFENILNQKAWTWRHGLAAHAYLVGGASEIALDNDYRSGNFSIQGQSSMLAAEAMQVKPGMRVLDACAAPGGKACYMAEAMQGTGRVYAWEVHEKRSLLLESAKRRLKLENLRISVRDAADPKPDYEDVMDAVLLDAPCTGLGVLTEKPDLKYRLQESDIAPIVAAQKKLLNTLCRYVKPGGTLVYSTCSILPEENEAQIQAFLAEHPSFSVQPLPSTYPESLREQQTGYGLQLFAHRDGVEGFFIARLRRARA